MSITIIIHDGDSLICVNIITPKDAILKFGKGICYKLVGAVLYHSLRLNEGHYTSYFLSPGQDQWFHANDNKVNTCLHEISNVLLVNNDLPEPTR